MQSSLGIYIEEGMVKYAKLQKDKESIRVESSNVVFYDTDLPSVLKQIVSETYSFKVPISINLSNEIYHTFALSSLLSKQDTKKASEIEFEMFCNEQNYNKLALEHKDIILDNKEEPEKQKAISIIGNKNEIDKTVKMFEGQKVSTITPITTSITNLVGVNDRANYMVVNIESKTQITTVIEGQVYRIDTIEDGMEGILSSINEIENSKTKAYEVCKNMTVYTRNMAEMYQQENEYAEIVNYTFDRIAEKVRDIMSELFSTIDKVYITGLGSSINNVDMYLQDYITNTKCEILTPFFVRAGSAQTPIKDYIEANSAIALALDGLGMVDREMNFTKTSNTASLKVLLTSDVSMETIKELFGELGNNIKSDFTAPLASSEKLLIRGIYVCLLVAIAFTGFSKAITNQIDKKEEEIQTAVTTTNVELAKLDSDIQTVSSRASVYRNLIQEITNPTAIVETTDTNGIETPTMTTSSISKDAIPNLLNRIMFVIPKKVKLTSIKNTSDNHIEIKAESEKYEQLGYFKVVLSTNEILQNVKSTSGQRNGSAIEVTIEGDLP